MRTPLSPLLLVAGVAILFAGAVARAEPIVVANPSFEDDILIDGFTDHTPTGWQSSPGGGDGAFNPPADAYPDGSVPDGQNVGYANEPGNRLHQTLVATVEADSDYTLEVEIGNRLDQTYVGYRIQLQAGGVVLAEDDSTQTPSPGEFVTARVTYSTGSSPPQLGQPLEIWLRSPGTQVNFDNVRLTRIGPLNVPTLDVFGALLLTSLLGLLGVGFLRRS